MQRRTTLVGDTWIGIVGPKAATYSSDERKRQEGIFEIIQTEELYAKKLAVILNVFYPKFCEKLTPDDLKTMFSTLLPISEVSKVILADFQKRQQESNYVVEKIGDIFLKHMGNLEPYLPYCSNQFRSSNFFTALLQKDVKFSTEIKLLYQDASFRALNGITFEAFLLEPMQRLTRYPILLKTVLHYTPKTHPDHENLLQASILLENFVSMTNEAARNESDMIKLTALQAKIDFEGLHEDIHLPGETRFLPSFSSCFDQKGSNAQRYPSDPRSLGARRCLFDGMLFKSKSGRKLHAFLFNDLFLLTQHHGIVPVAGYEYSVYRDPIPVHALLVREVPNGSVESPEFQILHVQTQQIIAVRAPSVNEKRRWMREIDSAFTHYQAILKKQKTPAAAAPTSKYIATIQVTVIEARNLLAMDPGGKSDPFCQVDLEGQIQKTKVVNKSLAPRWNAHLFFSASSVDQE